MKKGTKTFKFYGGHKFAKIDKISPTRVVAWVGDGPVGGLFVNPNIDEISRVPDCFKPSLTLWRFLLKISVVEATKSNSSFHCNLMQFVRNFVNSQIADDCDSWQV